jgi:hypothetical protein
MYESFCPIGIPQTLIEDESIRSFHFLLFAHNALKIVFILIIS